MAKGVLEVLLEYAEDIDERNFICCLSCLNAWDARKPYVFINYGNQERISNVAQPQPQPQPQGEGRKYVWNEEFTFQVEYEGEENIHDSYDKLILHVMDKHHLSGNDINIGEAMTHLKDVVILGMEKGKVKLHSQKYRIVQPDNSYFGDISFSVSFKRTDDGLEQDLRGN